MLRTVRASVCLGLLGVLGFACQHHEQADGGAGAGGKQASGNHRASAGAAGTQGHEGTAGSQGTAGGTGTTGNRGAAGNPGGGSDPGTTRRCPTPEEKTFSFFLTSHEALARLSESKDGFGGDLGGLAGADAICQSIAESVSACQKDRVWRAFLSTSTEDAIDRIGPGPWYDRVGRLFAESLEDLLGDRPLSADPAIIDDFPNESGVPNHNPSGSVGAEVDNHEILTGSGVDGRLYVQQPRSGFGSMACGDGERWTVEKATCRDWTSRLEEGCPRVGHSWPAPSGVNWISVWNEGGCAPGGVLTDDATPTGGPDGTRRVGSAGGYGGFYCFGLLE